MLVLSRQRDETIMIGDDIEVTVVDIRGDKVRLGINAPKSISVHRKEVYDAIRRENRAAAAVKPEDVAGLNRVTPPAPRLPASQTGAKCGSRSQRRLSAPSQPASAAVAQTAVPMNSGGATSAVSTIRRVRMAASSTALA